LGRFVKGDVVVLPFPFSDLTQTKRRPAIIIAELEGDDRILCQITSQHFHDAYSVQINDTDFKEGSLKKVSNVRPNRIFTADSKIILYRAGCLKADKVLNIIESVIEILKQ
jgi:mRNA interferase MazF